MIALAHYVEYKDDLYIIIKITGDMVKLWNTTDVVQAHSRNITPTNYRPALILMYRDKGYIRTAMGNVISLTTGKLMKRTSEQHREVMAITPWTDEI